MSLTEITIPTIERSFIAPGKPALLPTVWAEQRWRNCALLLTEDRRNFIVEHKVVLGDLECAATLFAVFDHG